MGIVQSLCAIVAGLGIVFAIPESSHANTSLTIGALAGAIGIAIALARSPRVCAVLLFMAGAVAVFMPLLFLIVWPVILFCGAVVVWHAAHRFTFRADHATSSKY